MKKACSLFLALCCLLGLLTGCSNGSGAGDKDTLTFLSWVRAETFDSSVGGSMDKSIMLALHSTLVALDGDGGIIPMLAESWEESEDNMFVTFKLRQDVKFHNGDPLTADDVIYSFDILYANTRSYTMQENIPTYEKIDDYTIRLGKVAPYAKIYEILAEQGYIYPKNYHSQDPEGYNNAPVGCGPYKFVSREADDSVRLEAFEDYFGDAPGFKNVIVKTPLEPASAVIALETGEVDLISHLPPTQAALVENNDKLTLVTTESSWSTHMLLLMGDPLYTDENLRKAIFHGVNPENAIKLSNEGIGSPAENLFAVRLMGDYAGTVENFVGYDPDLAKEYLEKSDYNGEEMVLSIMSNPALAESIQSDLKSLGINVSIEQLESSSWSTKMNKGEIQITEIELGTNAMSVQDFLSILSSSMPTYGENMAPSQEFDELVASLPTITDNDEQRAATIQALNILYDRTVTVPIYDSTFNYSYGPDVEYDCEVSASTYNFYLARVMPAK